MDSSTQEMLDKALQEGRIRKRQHGALLKHAAKYSHQHIERMVKEMSHTTLRAAHKIALEG